MKKILLLSDDNKLIDSFTNYYKDSSFYNVFLYKENMKNNNFDVLIIDLFMCETDIYSYLNSKYLVFLILPNIKFNMYSVFKKMNINFIFYKPVCMSYIDNIINLFYQNDIIIDPFRIEILNIFTELGLSLKLLGTQYLFDIFILILCENNSINNELYTIISERYNVLESTVIKNISYAISTCFNKGGNDKLKKEIFGYCYSDITGSISNYNFIYCIYIYIQNKVINANIK